MVNKKIINNKYALISVFNKYKLKNICKELTKYNYNFISTGSTCKKIKKLGYKCIEVSKITNFPEILDGRVKTIHPKLFASILFKENNLSHQKQFIKLKIQLNV